MRKESLARRSRDERRGIRKKRKRKKESELKFKESQNGCRDFKI